MKKNYPILLSLIIFMLCPILSLWGRDLLIVNDFHKPISGVNVIIYDSLKDSIGNTTSNESGRIMLSDNARYLLIQDSDSTTNLYDLLYIASDTICQSTPYELEELVVERENVTHHLTHDSYIISREAMNSYTTFYQALNEIPHLVVLPSGGLFFEGKENVVLLLNGVETTPTELSTISKDDVYRINTYRTPPPRFAGRNAEAAIDIITKNSLRGGNTSINIGQAFFPFKGNNNAAIFYNYKRSRFSAIFKNENEHFKKLRQDESLDYILDGIQYQKEKKGHDSKRDKDYNDLTLSFQNNLPGSYLYNVKIGGSLNHNNSSLHQDVSYNHESEKYAAINDMDIRYNTLWISNYFEKNIGKDGNAGTFIGNVNMQRLSSKYFSQYREFNYTDIPDGPYINEHSHYKTTFDAVISEMQYQLPQKQWGLLSFYLFDSYKHTNYRDSDNPLRQTTNSFGAGAIYQTSVGKMGYFFKMAFSGEHSSATTLDRPYNLWLPNPTARIYYIPTRRFYFSLSYQFTSDIPTIAQLSETNQWIDNNIVYHGNSLLKPYKTHNINLSGAYSTKYLYLTLNLSYKHANDMICNYYMYEKDYIIETLVNLKRYSEAFAQLDFTLMPLGNTKWTIWSRIIGAKVHGKGELYKWNGYRYQWMMYSSVNLPKWTFTISYQYPGKVAEGQLVMPRGQHWGLTAFYRPINDFSIGFTWNMPFGKAFSDSERTVGSAIVHNSRTFTVKERANIVYLNFSWNMSFGKKHIKENPQFENSNTDTGILQK